MDWQLADQLLCSVLHLKVLCLQNDHGFPFGSRIDAQAISNSDWICLGLEVFGCQIAGIPRPDITHTIGGSPESHHVLPGTLQDSIDIQRKIYSRVGRFTKLRKLTLGFPVLTDEEEVPERHMDFYRQFCCPAMTIDSGLDLLSGLKELRKVDLTNLEVYIDNEREQRWVKEN